jgi:tetratricopeptide (TPR) repeat protein
MTQTLQAIQAILKGNWEQAITLNLEILKQNPNDIESLNRLAFAYSAIGNVQKAKMLYQKVLKIDDANPIALKNLKKLTDGKQRKNGYSSFQINNTMFLEEVGKTKVIMLINTAPPKAIRLLQIGQPLVLCIKRLKIFVLDEHEKFLGMLPDNISRRLIKFMKGGNKYDAYVKAIEDSGVSIFLKEVKRVSKFKNQPSFTVSDIPKQTFLFKKHKNYDDEISEE